MKRVKIKPTGSIFIDVCLGLNLYGEKIIKKLHRKKGGGKK